MLGKEKLLGFFFSVKTLKMLGKIVLREVQPLLSYFRKEHYLPLTFYQ